MTQQEDLSATVRRGLLSVFLAKAWFLLTGLISQLLLPRAFGSAAVFGDFSLVIAWLFTVHNVTTAVTTQSVAYFGAPSASALERAKATGLRLQAIIGGGGGGLLLLLAPAIAAFEHDGELRPKLQISAVVVLFSSLYAVFIGAANGARQFRRQAALDMTSSALRLVLVLGLSFALHTTLAAVSGLCLSSALVALIAMYVVGLPSRSSGSPIPVRAMLRFSAWLVLYLLAFNTLMFIDGIWLKRMCALTGQSKQVVDGLVGVYSAVQNVGRLPLQLIFVGNSVVFPLISRAAQEGDPVRVRRHAASALRYSLCATLAVAAGLGTRPEATLRLLYPVPYAVAAPALPVMLLGYVLFSLSAISGTLLNGLGKTRPVTLSGLITLCATLCALHLSLRAGLHAGQLPYGPAARGMAIGFLCGVLLLQLLLWHFCRVHLAPLTLMRVAVATGAALGLGRLWPAVGSAGALGGKGGTVLCAGLAVLVHLSVLLLLGELSLAELLAFRRGNAAAPAPSVPLHRTAC